MVATARCSGWQGSDKTCVFRNRLTSEASRLAEARLSQGGGARSQRADAPQLWWTDQAVVLNSCDKICRLTLATLLRSSRRAFTRACTHGWSRASIRMGTCTKPFWGQLCSRRSRGKLASRLLPKLVQLQAPRSTTMLACCCGDSKRDAEVVTTEDSAPVLFGESEDKGKADLGGARPVQALLTVGMGPALRLIETGNRRLEAHFARVLDRGRSLLTPPVTCGRARALGAAGALRRRRAHTPLVQALCARALADGQGGPAAVDGTNASAECGRLSSPAVGGYPMLCRDWPCNSFDTHGNLLLKDKRKLLRGTEWPSLSSYTSQSPLLPELTLPRGERTAREQQIST